MAQGDEVARFLRRLNAGDAGNTQDVALLSGAALNQSQGRRQHHNAPRGYTDASGVGFVGHIDHVGLAMRIKVGECGHTEIRNELT